MRQNAGKANLIIEAAEAIFVEKGFHKATMREIARAAGLGLGTIYEYFTDKESLLSAIPEYKMAELLNGLREHLQGICGTFNKLRKLTWFTLCYYEANPNFVSFIYLIMKPHRGWIDSPGNRLVQEYTRIISDILKEGQQEGIVRTDIDVRLMRIVYLGSLERLAISWLLRGKPASLISAYDDFTELVIAALVNQEATMALAADCPFMKGQAGRIRAKDAATDVANIRISEHK